MSTHSSVFGFPTPGAAEKSTSGPQYTEKHVTWPCPTGVWSAISMWATSVSTAWYTGRSASPTLSIRMASTRRASASVSTTATSSMRPVKLEALSPTLDESLVWRAVTPSPSSSETDAASKSKPARKVCFRRGRTDRREKTTSAARRANSLFGFFRKKNAPSGETGRVSGTARAFPRRIWKIRGVREDAPAAAALRALVLPFAGLWCKLILSPLNRRILGPPEAYPRSSPSSSSVAPSGTDNARLAILRRGAPWTRSPGVSRPAPSKEASARAPNVASRRHDVARATLDADLDALWVPAAGNPREAAAPAQQGETPANIFTLVSQARRLVRLSIPRP